MKKLLYLTVICLLLIACKKGKNTPSPTLVNNIVGKWGIVSVTTIFRDSLGNKTGSKTYPEPNGYYFKFNTDGTWLENLDPTNVDDIGVSGNYTLSSDSNFTLSYVTSTLTTPCKVISMSASQFNFSHQRSTLFNGVTPGTIEYDFVLTR